MLNIENLTRGDIDALEVCPEVDLLVAESILGWKRWTFENGGYRVFPPDFDVLSLFRAGTVREYQDGDQPADDLTYNVPEFTADRLYAFMVLDKIVGNGWSCELSMASQEDAHVKFMRFFKSGRCVAANDGPFPDAVCKAALKALLSERHLTG